MFSLDSCSVRKHSEISCFITVLLYKIEMCLKDNQTIFFYCQILTNLNCWQKQEKKKNSSSILTLFRFNQGTLITGFFFSRSCKTDKGLCLQMPCWLMYCDMISVQKCNDKPEILETSTYSVCIKAFALLHYWGPKCGSKHLESGLKHVLRSKVYIAHKKNELICDCEFSQIQIKILWLFLIRSFVQSSQVFPAGLRRPT